MKLFCPEKDFGCSNAFSSSLSNLLQSVLFMYWNCFCSLSLFIQSLICLFHLSFNIWFAWMITKKHCIQMKKMFNILKLFLFLSIWWKASVNQPIHLMHQSSSPVLLFVLSFLSLIATTRKSTHKTLRGFDEWSVHQLNYAKQIL